MSARVRESVSVIADSESGWRGVGISGEVLPHTAIRNGKPLYPLHAMLPPLFPEWLGDRGFLAAHQVRFPYIAGEMANGIAGPQLVIAMAQAGMLAFFGAGGLDPERVEAALSEIERATGPDVSWGANLIHSPSDPEMETAVANLYLRRKVRRVCASAYMRVTPAVVRYACSGLSLGAGGEVERANHLFAKLSRPEVARQFLSPAPPDIVAGLVSAGKLTAGEADLARRVPLAEDITVEADSGGHTDNRPLSVIFPAVAAERDRISAELNYSSPIRIGASGGLGTPSAVAAAFALGAAYVLTGSINQSSVEANLSPVAKGMLAKAGIADVIMAPAPDMFEMGVKVQVLKSGTLFWQRAAELYELYRKYSSLEEIPAELRDRLERKTFQRTFDQVWAETRSFFERRNPADVARAAQEPRHKMALVFRWYVGRSSRWAIAGDPERVLDYQLWCGPSMGAFNDWAKGSFLEHLSQRHVVQIARNLMEGAAVITRAQQLRSYGVPVPEQAFQFRPRPLQ